MLEKEQARNRWQRIVYRPKASSDNMPDTVVRANERGMSDRLQSLRDQLAEHGNVFCQSDCRHAVESGLTTEAGLCCYFCPGRGTVGCEPCSTVPEYCEDGTVVATAPAQSQPRTLAQVFNGESYRAAYMDYLEVVECHNCEEELLVSETYSVEDEYGDHVLMCESCSER